jgi:hypothetical protein
VLEHSTKVGDIKIIESQASIAAFPLHFYRSWDAERIIYQEKSTLHTAAM